ncbi:MAG: DUF6084 family protein [Acidobacteriota bacterium]
MPDLHFEIRAAEAQAYAAAPTLIFKLEITNANSQESIHTVALRCQIQIETTQRRYSATEQERLHDLFDKPSRWHQTLRTLLWTHTSVIAPSFTGSALIDLPVPCTFDFNVAATKYFAGLESGEVPLVLQFSGTIFYAGATHPLQVAQIPWSKEAKYRLPISVWQEMMNLYYPNTAWLSLRRDVFDRLYLYKIERGLPTWEQTLEQLLSASAQSPKNETPGMQAIETDDNETVH